MKKVGTILVSFALFLSFGGCSRTKTFDVYHARSLSIQSADSGTMITIVDEAELEAIAMNFASIQWKRAGKNQDSTGWSYRLCWYDENGKCMEDVTIVNNGQILWNGYLYTSKQVVINTTMLEELLYKYGV